MIIQITNNFPVESLSVKNGMNSYYGIYLDDF
jgi:hypothetical protein